MAKPRQGQTAQAVPPRLPSTRERRPALAALALLLIVGGALASGWMALRAGDRADFLRVSDEVAQGEKIDGSDLETVRLPEDFDGAVPAGDKSSIEGQYATTRLLPKTILTSDMVNEKSGVADGTVQIPISSDSARGVADLSAGANVAVYLTGGGSGAQAVRGQVVRVSQSEGSSGIGGSSGGDITASVSVDISCGDAVSAANAEDGVQLGLIGEVDDTAVVSTCEN